jgi:5'-3' exonuclease
LREFLTGVGANIITAAEEAERLCATLVLVGKCDIVISNDTDCLAHGVSYISWEKGKWKYYDIGVILDRMHFSQDMFVNYCMLLGSDYGARIKGIGPARAKKIIDDYPDLTNWTHAEKHTVNFDAIRLQFGRDPTYIIEDDDETHEE